MKTVFRGILAAAVVVLGMSGCASQQYVDQQMSASEARIGALEANVGTLQEEVVGLKRSDAVQTEKLERLSDTAKEALSRAQEAGNLAKGRFLYEIRLDSTVKFGFDKTGLSPEAEAALDDFAARLKAEDKNVFIEIQGHTDDAGPEKYNLALGKRRADAVKRYLHMNCGVPLARMSVISYGEERPLANNSIPEGRAENRCVVLVIME
jgi:outer membrane protein OmpA-like peptidoglycan-associated protein